MVGIEGRHMPPVALTAEAVPRASPAPGCARCASRSAESTSPCASSPTPAAQLAATTRQLLRWFNPARAADGRLRVTTADGLGREVSCRYMQGLELADDLGAWRTDWRTTVSAGRGPQSLLVRPRASGSPRSAWARSPVVPFPVPPLRLSSSTVFAAPSIDNPGDVEAWPVSTITRQGTNPTLRDLTARPCCAL